jgi:hypothetical protein
MKVRDVSFKALGILVLAGAGAFALPCPAQSAAATGAAGKPVKEERAAPTEFRVETTPVVGGAEIVTIFSRHSNNASGESSELPLVSVLRDTLGDDKKENDRLRYVWMLTYTEPSVLQKASAFVPFLYARTSNKKGVGSGPPPKLADLNGTGGGPLKGVTWYLFRKLILNDYGIGPRASILQYRQNTADYRSSSIARALAVLSVSGRADGDEGLTETERHDITARLAFSNKFLGGHLQSNNLERAYKQEYEKSSDFRNQNWELLRQHSEAQGLYFEPLKMPDGTVRHALVWAAAEDLEANRGHKFDSRFLNIKSPWADAKLFDRKGYSEKRWFDTDGREVGPNSPGATPRTMMPLAVYGLDHPKIPALLIDFRDSGNAKRREMSRRLLHDVMGNVVSLSPFSSLEYMLGRYVFYWFTSRRGMDVNQISRVNSYSQLKLLLSLDTSLDNDLRREIERRIEDVSLNPLENDVGAEAMIARRQYDNLMAYAKRPDGLPARLQKMRREEMTKLAHSPKERMLFSLAHTLTFGIYTHRETATPELLAQIDTRRQLDFHERRLAEIARQSVKPEVDSNTTDLRESLAFVSTNGSAAKDKTVRSLARIYSITGDTDLRDLCLAGLYKINNASAKSQLLAIYHDPGTDDRVRNMSVRYLKLAVAEGQRISSRNVAAITAITGIATN